MSELTKMIKSKQDDWDDEQSFYVVPSTSRQDEPIENLDKANLASEGIPVADKPVEAESDTNNATTITTNPPDQNLSKFVKVIEPPTFDGNDKEKARQWLNDYDKLMSIYGYNDQQKQTLAFLYLKDGARSWYNTTKYIEPDIDWLSFKQNFLDHFCGSNRVELTADAKQRDDESPSRYLVRTVDTCLKIDPVNMTEDEIILKILSGLKEEVKAKLKQVSIGERTLKWLRKELTDYVDEQDDETTSMKTAIIDDDSAPPTIQHEDFIQKPSYEFLINELAEYKRTLKNEFILRVTKQYWSSYEGPWFCLLYGSGGDKYTSFLEEYQVDGWTSLTYLCENLSFRYDIEGATTYITHYEGCPSGLDGKLQWRFDFSTFTDWKMIEIRMDCLILNSTDADLRIVNHIGEEEDTHTETRKLQLNTLNTLTREQFKYSIGTLDLIVTLKSVDSSSHRPQLFRRACDGSDTHQSTFIFYVY